MTATACVVFTANEGIRGGRVIPLKKTVDEALQGCDCVKKVYVMKRTDSETAMESDRDVWLEEVSVICLISNCQTIVTLHDIRRQPGE